MNAMANRQRRLKLCLACGRSGVSASWLKTAFGIAGACRHHFAGVFTDFTPHHERNERHERYRTHQITAIFIGLAHHGAGITKMSSARLTAVTRRETA